MTSLWLDRPPVPVAPASVPDRADVVVAGAGITGLVCALLLARAGREVTVLEGRSIGAGATGNTTAKISLLQGNVLSQIRRHQGREVTAAYVAGNAAARAWLEGFMTDAAVPFQVRDAVTFATDGDAADAVAREEEAATEAGLPVTQGVAEPLPFQPHSAIRLADQLQVDPMDLLAALARALHDAGGVIVEGVRVTGVSPTATSIDTTRGEVRVDTLVLATGAPFLDRSLYFAKLTAHRSYAAALRTDRPIPSAMYLSLDDPAVSLRTAPTRGGEALLVGGHGHVVGRTASPADHVARLLGWARAHWPDAEITHTWSAQDYRSASHVPFVGPLPITGGRVHVATGFNKWGMTNGVASAMTIADRITGAELPDWAQRLGHRLTTPRDVAEGVSMGAGTAKAGASMLARVAGGALASTRKGAGGVPAEGQGHVELDGVVPVAVSTVDGRTCRVSALCTHLGGVVRWNDQDRSWDCPLHGSRFAPDGSVLEGMATRPLRARD